MRLLSTLTLLLLFILFILSINARGVQIQHDTNEFEEEIQELDDKAEIINADRELNKRSINSNNIPIITETGAELQETDTDVVTRDERSIKGRRKFKNRNKNKKNRKNNKPMQSASCACPNKKTSKIAKTIPLEYKAELTKISNKKGNKKISAQTVYSSDEKQAMLVKTKGDKRNAKQTNKLYLFDKNKSFKWEKKGKSCQMRTLGKNAQHVPNFLIGMAEGKKKGSGKGQEKYVKKLKGTKYMTIVSPGKEGKGRTPMSAEVKSKKGVTLYEVKDFKANVKAKFSVPKICKY